MAITILREQLFVETCAQGGQAGKIIEIQNSEREKELRKVWVDCSMVDEVQLFKFDCNKKSISVLFRPGRHGHQKFCDGVIVARIGEEFHAVFCELKTTWEATAITQIRNTELFFDYACGLAKEWMGAPQTAVRPWYAVMVSGRMPPPKRLTQFAPNSVPNASKASNNFKLPQRIKVTDTRGMGPGSPLSLAELIRI